MEPNSTYILYIYAIYKIYTVYILCTWEVENKLYHVYYGMTAKKCRKQTTLFYNIKHLFL